MVQRNTGGTEKRCRRIARFRLGNEMAEGKYWECAGAKEV